MLLCATRASTTVCTTPEIAVHTQNICSLCVHLERELRGGEGGDRIGASGKDLRVGNNSLTDGAMARCANYLRGIIK